MGGPRTVMGGPYFIRHLDLFYSVQKPTVFVAQQQLYFSCNHFFCDFLSYQTLKSKYFEKSNYNGTLKNMGAKWGICHLLKLSD